MLFASLFSGFVLSLGLLFTGADAPKDKPVAQDCCAQKLACCTKDGACCAAATKLGCCTKAMSCCGKDQACCAAVQTCCQEGDKCCAEAKACCGTTTKKAAAKPASKGCCGE